MIRRFGRLGVWLASCSLLAIGLAVASGQAETPATTSSSTPGLAAVTIPNPNGSQIQMNFGTRRGMLTTSIVLVVSPPADIRAYVLGDLRRQDGATQLSANKISVTTKVDSANSSSSEQVVTLAVKVDPSDAAPGVYSGAIRMVAAVGSAQVLPLTITLKGGSAWSVFLVIAFGSLFGILAKWLSDSGATLNQSNQRYLRMMSQLTQIWPSVPLVYKSQLEQVRLAISQLDASTSTTLLGLLDTTLSTVLRQATLLADVAAELASQDALTPKSGVDQAADVVSVERQLLAQRLRDTLPTDSPDRLEADLSAIQAFSTLLRTYSSATAPQKATLTGAVGKYLNGDFVGGLKSIQALALGTTSGVLGAAALVAAPEPPAPPSGYKRLLAGASSIVVQWQPWLSSVIVALLTAVLGVETLFFANPTFGANGADWLVAFGWGFGLQLAGGTLVQIGGNLAARGPKLA